MNVAFGIISIIISTFIGFRLSFKYTEKKDFYKYYRQFNSNLENEVSFLNNTLLSIIEKSDKDIYFYRVLEDKIVNDKKEKIAFLSKDENDYFFEYSEKVGKTDKAGQLELITFTKKYLTEKYETAEKEEKKYKKLYIKMGFLIGLLIFIVII
ncbi:MAG: hypothetical protein IJR66_00670 [Clostridia bacterium]|nr:hypothetical protein [Clostridia bacterium]